MTFAEYKKMSEKEIELLEKTNAEYSKMSQDDFINAMFSENTTETQKELNAISRAIMEYRTANPIIIVDNFSDLNEIDRCATETEATDKYGKNANIWYDTGVAPYFGMSFDS